ncbi:MAG: VWA domain-containing protein [Acidobacteria bacterium]|nr:VWA domain-containing protein [Acidobacteriota bacterium]
MFRQRRHRHFGIVVTLAVVAILSAFLRAVPSAQSPAPAGQARAIPVEIVVLDRDGRTADTLTPANFTVTVDGKPRPVLWVRYVSRGPGASDEAAQRLPGRTETLSFAAEPARNVLVVVDEYSIQRGDERMVQQAAIALIDRLGLDDRVGVLRIPVMRDARLALTTERPEVRGSLRQIVGQATQSVGVGADQLPAQQQSLGTDPNRVTSDPDRAAMTERQPTEAQAPGRVGDETAVSQPGFLPNLQAVLNAMRESRGRKILAIFSAGFPQVAVARVDDVARAAIAAHATIYAVGLPGARDDVANPLDVGALERLAKATGGTFTMLGKNADKSLEGVMPELSACYVLGIEPGPTDTDGARHTLRVEAPRQLLTIRAPGWLVPRQDVDDLVPPAASAPRGSGAAEPTTGARGVSIVDVSAPPTGPAPRTASPSPRDLELQRLVARASDYIAGYQREYSLLVAEENYVQSTRGQRQQIRSDLLLVRRDGASGWTSFRDVFEVNGEAVRDRDDRLKRLFLDPSIESQAQLMAIKSESARYNIGPVERNINVPLFALEFLEYKNLSRFRFKLGGTKEVGGVVSTRIDYEEIGRPTLVSYNNAKDIDGRGWFLIDPASGAITGSRMQFTFPDDVSNIEFVVKYGRDATLGLWVPVEMTEVFSRNPNLTGGSAVTIDARATYSKFRRFQVKTDTEIKIVK